MKIAPQSSDGDTLDGSRGKKQPGSQQEAGAPPLPHEADQDPESQHEDHPRQVGKQAHRDLERGLKDTDRRGGDEYQQQTQEDAHTDVNSGAKGAGSGPGKH